MLIENQKSEAETIVDYAVEIFYDQKFVNINDEIPSSRIGAPTVKTLPIFYGPEFSLLFSKVSAIFLYRPIASNMNLPQHRKLFH
jgi:hypothetical protein